MTRRARCRLRSLLIVASGALIVSSSVLAVAVSTSSAFAAPPPDFQVTLPRPDRTLPKLRATLDWLEGADPRLSPVTIEAMLSRIGLRGLDPAALKARGVRDSKPIRIFAGSGVELIVTEAEIADPELATRWLQELEALPNAQPWMTTHKRLRGVSILDLDPARPRAIASVVLDGSDGAIVELGSDSARWVLEALRSDGRGRAGASAKTLNAKTGMGVTEEQRNGQTIHARPSLERSVAWPWLIGSGRRPRLEEARAAFGREAESADVLFGARDIEPIERLQGLAWLDVGRMRIRARLAFGLASGLLVADLAATKPSTPLFALSGSTPVAEVVGRLDRPRTGATWIVPPRAAGMLTGEFHGILSDRGGIVVAARTKNGLPPEDTAILRHAIAESWPDAAVEVASPSPERTFVVARFPAQDGLPLEIRWLGEGESKARASNTPIMVEIAPRRLLDTLDARRRARKGPALSTAAVLGLRVAFSEFLSGTEKCRSTIEVRANTVRVDAEVKYDTAPRP